MRLAGSATIAEANEVLDNFIPRFNERFGVQAEQDCPTYASVQVEVQEDLEGELLVQYQGQTVPSQEAPQSPAQLRENAAAIPENSGQARGVNGTGDRWDPHLATLEAGEIDRDLRSRKSRAQQHLIPTARQRALWEKVQQAKRRGLSLRAMALELGVHRNTVRKYALAESPPLRKKKGVTGMQQTQRDAST